MYYFLFLDFLFINMTRLLCGLTFLLIERSRKKLFVRHSLLKYSSQNRYYYFSFSREKNYQLFDDSFFPINKNRKKHRKMRLVLFLSYLLSFLPSSSSYYYFSRSRKKMTVLSLNFHIILISFTKR